MNHYLGVKLITAEPMTHGEYSIEKYGELTNTAFSIQNKDSAGYKVIYEDGYVSWSPKVVFEKAYLPLAQESSITLEDVDNFIVYYEDFTIGLKTTIVKATLANGYEIVEASSCVDPKNFNHDLGIKICKDKIKDKIWPLLGFLLQTGKYGVKKGGEDNNG